MDEINQKSNISQGDLTLNDLNIGPMTINTKTLICNYIKKSLLICKSYSMTYYRSSEKWKYIANGLTLMHVISSILGMISTSATMDQNLKEYLTIVLFGLNIIISGIARGFQPERRQTLDQSAGDNYKTTGIWAEGVTVIMDELSDESLFIKFKKMQENLQELTNKYDEPNPNEVDVYRHKLEEGVFNLT